MRFSVPALVAVLLLAVAAGCAVGPDEQADLTRRETDSPSLTVRITNRTAHPMHLESRGGSGGPQPALQTTLPVGATDTVSLSGAGTLDLGVLYTAEGVAGSVGGRFELAPGGTNTASCSTIDATVTFDRCTIASGSEVEADLVATGWS